MIINPSHKKKIQTVPHTEHGDLTINVHGSQEGFKHMLRNGTPWAFNESSPHLQKQHVKSQHDQNAHFYDRKAKFPIPQNANAQEFIFPTTGINAPRAGTPTNKNFNACTEHGCFRGEEEPNTLVSLKRHVYHHENDKSRAGCTKNCVKTTNRKRVKPIQHKKRSSGILAGKKGFNGQKSSKYMYQMISPNAEFKDTHNLCEQKTKRRKKCSHYATEETIEEFHIRKIKTQKGNNIDHVDKIFHSDLRKDQKRKSYKKKLITKYGPRQNTNSIQMKSILSYDAPMIGLLDEASFKNFGQK